MSRKPTVVLLHALGASHQMWDPQVKELFGQFNLVVPDLPGHGDNHTRFTMDSAVDQVLKTIRINTSRPVYLVGASLGATVALRVALAAPARVAGLMLSGALVKVPGPSLAMQSLITRMFPLRALAIASAQKAGPASAEDRNALILDTLRAGKRTQLDALRALRKDDVLERLGRVTVPTMVCCGSRDKLNLPSATLLHDMIPGATLRIIDNGDHLWNLQQPDECTKIIRDFAGEAG